MTDVTSLPPISCSVSSVRLELRYFVCTLILLVMATSARLDAQDDFPLHDTRGTEFWVAFMQNTGSESTAITSSMLRLYIACDSVTTVRIIYSEQPLDTLVIPISTPRLPFEVNLNSIFGEQTELSEVQSDGSNAIQNRSFHVLAENEITLYGVSIRRMSADAYMVLPDDVLGRSHVVMGWENAYTIIDRVYDMHSEYAVIATEDRTRVTITPTAFQTDRRDTIPFEVQLNRGEVYFGQALEGLVLDVTGTEIRSNKPVAVISGNQRTSIPTKVGNYRDHLVEQVPPVAAWGKTAILTPHSIADPASPWDAQARILSVFDSTQITITYLSRGTELIDSLIVHDTIMLRKNQPYAFVPLRAATVIGDKPILVAQFEHSTSSDTMDSQLGDPFMMLIPPPEQYDTGYAFQSIINEQFVQHYINVIIPEGAESTLRLDGAPVSARYYPVPGSNYLFAQIRVDAGAHYINASQQFGLCVYGYGVAVSYGYIGGSLYRDLVVDFQRPEITSRQVCEELFGLITDDQITDLGIDSVAFTGRASNAVGQIEAFEEGADSVRFTASLVDPYQDGFLEIRAVDHVGRSTTLEIPVPGMTVSLTEMNGYAPAVDGIPSFNNRAVCRTFNLFNYGKFPQDLSELALSPGTLTGVSVNLADRSPLQPGETRGVSICYDGVQPINDTLHLSLANECLTRDLADLLIVSITDVDPPMSSLTAGDCLNGSDVTFSEPDQPFLQIDSLIVDTVINGTWSISPSRLPSRSARLQLNVVDFREDMIVRARAIDMAGNTSTFADTIAGFRLKVHEPDSTPQLALRLGVDWTTDSVRLLGMVCDSIDLTNNGREDLTITRMFMFGNSDFSIPPSQLPVYIPVGGTKRVAVCLEGIAAGEQIDTLWIEDGCHRWESVLVKTPVAPTSGTGSDICGNGIRIESFGAAKETFMMDPVPNPAGKGSVRIDLGLKQDEILTIDAIDMMGVQRQVLLEAMPVPAGVHRFTIETLQLPAGSYLLRMQTEGGEMRVTHLVVRP